MNIFYARKKKNWLKRKGYVLPKYMIKIDSEINILNEKNSNLKLTQQD